MEPLAGCSATGCHPANIRNTHHATTAAQAGNCAECHSALPQTVSCKSCHDADYWSVPDANGNPTQVDQLGKPLDARSTHHASASAQSCEQCHSNAPRPSACIDCHHETAAPFHHVMADGGGAIKCDHCHGSAIAVNFSVNDAGVRPACQDCHEPSDANRSKHHTLATSRDDLSCNKCHSDASPVPGCDTSSCHGTTFWQQPERAGSAQAQHHDVVRVKQSLDCSTCHASVAAMGGCRSIDCHGDGTWFNATKNLHHETVTKVTYQYGCLSCHSLGHDPVTGVDIILPPTEEKCESCHTVFVNQASVPAIHHATDSFANNDCIKCHAGIADINPQSLDCATCHAGQSPKDGKAAMHHATNTANAGDCTACHSSVNASNLACESCHAAEPVLNGSMAMHHGTTDAAPDYTLGNCTTCHVGADAGINCATCHAAINTAANVDRHHFSRLATTNPNACIQCHSAIDTTALSNCEDCHAQQQGALNGSVTMHHSMTEAGMLQNCTACHEGAAIAENACSSCHTGTDSAQALAERHHLNTQAGQSGLCSTCHVGAQAQGIVCAACHGEDTQPIGHHEQPQYAAGNCLYCHDAITLNGANCEECHTGNGKPSIPETHHAAPLASVGGDCSFCHQSVSSPDVCANCHAASPHHTTLAAQFGVCEQCHTWPADKDENPQQGSCRQCHGQYMHGKNSAAPIHDYRACFSCHGSGGSMTSSFPQAAVVLPFHASPGKAVGFSSGSDALAPGRGSFNLFYSSWGGSSRNEERFGEHENWENLGDRNRTPGISYTKVQISEQGKTYQVPAFSNIPAPDLPGGGGTGGGGGLTVCASCHGDYSGLVSCSNLKWRDHQTLNRVDLATYQLAESTYLGSYCPDLPAEPVNLALNKSASSSDDEGSSYRASRAVDGDGSTRWYVRSGSSEWLKVDLGQRVQISQVVIKWHSEYAREYDVEVSTDNRNWTRVKSESSGNGGTDTVTFGARDARYVLIDCKRERDRGYSIYELEVYAP
jgi:nitrate/TMAO reductase-like tetraheme cytochrome c subunit